MTGPKLPKRAEAGIVIGGYELVRRIGRGGMAEVWVARKALGKKGSKFVAIKLIADHHVGDERYARMFRSEAELAAVLSHANIVQVFDEGEDEGRSYLVMEWVDGLNLLKLGDMLALLDDEQRRFRVISYIIGQLLHALHYAHSITSHDGSPLGVVHRDVSPQNVLVSNHGEVKLTDFGVAYYNIEESSGIHVKGKVRYMSPEQLSGKTRSPTVDLYAVGALLHELLDGRKFRGEFEDGQDLFTVVLSGHVSAMTRPVPPELDRLRVALLDPDPAQRLQTAEHALALLKRFHDYGDARVELTKLCGSLTGVVKPRVGPGQSDLVAAADQATTRWGGRTPLAKPKVEAERERPVAAKPPARPLPPVPSVPPIPPLRTGSTTAVKSPTEALPKSEALITGQTEFVKISSLPSLASAAAVSSNAPTTPMQRSSLRDLVAQPMVQGPSSAPGGAAPTYVPSPPVPQAPAPAYVREQPSSPLGGQPQAWASAGGAPIFVPEQPSSPLGGQPHPQASAGGAPPYVPAQPSHPIQVQAAPVWVDPGSGGIPPTELLSQSEISGAAPYQASADVVDGHSVAEIPSGSGTDRDILPVRVAGDGTDTRQEIPGRMHTRTNPAIALPQRSAMAIIGVGLLMVAVMSVSITWYLFTRGKDEVAPTSLAASAVESKPLEPAPADDAKDAEGKAEAVAVSAGEVPQVDEELQLEGDGQEPAGGEPGSEAVDTPVPPTADEPLALEEAPAPTVKDAAKEEEAEPEPVDDAKPGGDERPKAAKALPKAVVQIFNNTKVTEIQVRLGPQLFEASDKREHKITPGKKPIKWRTSPTAAWRDAGSWDFKSGKRFNVIISKKGLAVRISS